MSLQYEPMKKQSMLHRATVDVIHVYRNCQRSFTYAMQTNPKRVLTKNAMPCGNYNLDNEQHDLILRVHDSLCSEKEEYIVLDLLGQGTFGQIIKNHPAYHQQANTEVDILNMLNEEYDPEDRHHIVRIIDSFMFKNHLCIGFELLSLNLYEVLCRHQHREFRGLALPVVRGIVIQLLDVLSLIADADVIHSDLKPENILLAGGDQVIDLSDDPFNGDIQNQRRIPLIKLIDFGSAAFGHTSNTTYIQSRFYRSPEVILGLPYDGAIDAWSLGCISAEIFLGLPLFPGMSNHDQLQLITRMLGEIPHCMTTTSPYFSKYYNVGNNKSRATLKSAKQYAMDLGCEEQSYRSHFKHEKLEDIIKAFPVSRCQKNLAYEAERRAAFTHFVKGLLQVNPKRRWTPRQAATHPFVTGERFSPTFKPSESLRRVYFSKKDRRSGSQVRKSCDMAHSVPNIALQYPQNPNSYRPMLRPPRLPSAFNQQGTYWTASNQTLHENYTPPRVTYTKNTKSGMVEQRENVQPSWMPQCSIDGQHSEWKMASYFNSHHSQSSQHSAGGKTDASHCNYSRDSDISSISFDYCSNEENKGSSMMPFGYVVPCDPFGDECGNNEKVYYSSTPFKNRSKKFNPKLNSSKPDSSKKTVLQGRSTIKNRKIEQQKRGKSNQQDHDPSNDQNVRPSHIPITRRGNNQKDNAIQNLTRAFNQSLQIVHSKSDMLYPTQQTNTKSGIGR